MESPIEMDDLGVQDGAPKIAKLPYFSGLYNYSIHGGYFMVYKPTNISGGPYPVPNFRKPPLSH